MVCTEDDSHRVVVLCILYHVSMSEKCSALFSYTDCIPTVSVCLYMCVCVYVCVSAHTCMCIYMCVSLCLYACLGTHVCLYVASM